MAIQVYQGIITANDVRLYKNGTKKMMVGRITIPNELGSTSSYKMVSFRSQVYIQSETLGQDRMANIRATVHGTFKENEWQGEISLNFICDKLYLDGYEQLAIDAEKSSMNLPAVPQGTLPNQPIAPITNAAFTPPVAAVAAPITNAAFTPPVAAVAAPITNAAYTPPVAAVAAPITNAAFTPPVAAAAPITNAAYTPPVAAAAPITNAAFTPPVAVAPAPIAATKVVKNRTKKNIPAKLKPEIMSVEDVD